MTTKLKIYRQGVKHLEVDIDERTEYSGAVMMENYVSAIIVAGEELDIRVNDYIVTFWNEKFTVNQKPNVIYSESGETVTHEVMFEGAIYELIDSQFKYHGNSIDPEFYGTASEFLDELIANMGRTHTGWVKGSVASTERKFISFTSHSGTGVTCREALAIACEQFGLEFQIETLIDGQAVHMLENIGRDTGVVFRVGKGKGLIDLERFYPDNYKEYNRIYGVGSAQNIPPDYRGGTTRLTFDPGYIERPLEPGEQRREASKDFDIKPERTGTVTTVSEDGLSFTDTSLDFDLDDQRITGVDALVSFKTGDLTGREFVIKAWIADTKTIIIEPYEESGREFPGEKFEIKVGDEYTLLDIEMPQSYIDDAEIRLEAALEEWGLKVLEPSYRTTNDQKFLRDNDIWLRAYDRVQVEDPKHGTSRMLRINRIRFPYCSPFEAQFEISDEVIFTSVERQVIEQIEQKQIVKEINRTSIERSRRNAYRTRQTMDLIFDPVTGEQTKLAATLIQAMMAVFGSVASNFELYGVVFDGITDPEVFDVTAGMLVHFDKDITGEGSNEWNMPARTINELDPEESYYLFARCNKESNLATWVLSDEIITLESEDGYWHFFVGILFDVYDGGRDFKTAYGITKILANRITTGRISSQDGLTYFDLNSGTIQGNIRFSSGKSVEDEVVNAFDKAVEAEGLANDAWEYADDAYDQAEAADTKATGAINSINDMGADGKITPVEKLELQTHVRSIQEEYASIINQSTRYSVTATNYINAYSALISYTNTILANMSVTTSIVRSTYNNNFGNYYYQKAILLNVIAQSAKSSSENYTDGKIATFYTDLGELAFADMVSIAKLDSTVIVGGYLKNTLIDTVWLKADVINAAYINALELVARYIRAGEPGVSRIEVNERRERKTSTGAGTGVFEDQNNIAIFSAAGTKLAEIDDNSSPGLGVFYLEFPAGPTTDPGFTRFRGEMKERDWSQYNPGSYDSRTGQEGDFSNGFPKFIFDLVRVPIGSTRVRYYFRRAEQGFNASDPNADNSLSPNTSIGPTLSNLNNTAMWGAVSRGHTRVLGMESGFNEYQLDGGSPGLNLLDSDIILLNSSSNITFTMPRFINGGVIDQDAIDRCMYGREVRIINKTNTRVITINASGSGDNMFIGDGGFETSTVAVSQGMTITLKLISKNSVPNHISEWRWAVILKGYNQYMG